MNTCLFSALVAASTLALGASAAHASMESCKASAVLTKNGDYTSYELSDTFPGVPTDRAYTKLYRAVSNKYEVKSSDREALVIEADQQSPMSTWGRIIGARAEQVLLHFNLEPKKGGTRVSVSMGTSLHVDSVKPDAFCEIIEAVGN